MTGIWNVIVVQYNLLSTLAIDVGVAIYNTFTPSLPKGSVIPAGRPGHGGIWPPYEPPKEGYSRSPCPALNALANHGILPRDGKNIRFTEMSRKIHETYNFANTFCFVVPYYCANMLGRDYHRDTFNLADLALHNGIEHDASLCRVDTALCPNQADIHQPYIERLLASASGPNETLTRADVARQLSIRRAESRVENPEFSLALIHKAFGSINATTMLVVFGGDTNVLRSMLLEERIPDGWEPFIRSRKGLSMAAFNPIVLRTHMRINEQAEAAEVKKST